MSYAHTQRARLDWLLWATAVLMLVAAWFARESLLVAVVVAGVAGVVALLAFSFRTLTVCDEGDALGIRFGPVALLRKRVPYASMHAVRAARSKLLDGWGVHWVPGRGWTWNIWGLDCVEIETDRGILRVGTDDRDALLAFLQARIAGGTA